MRVLAALAVMVGHGGIWVTQPVWVRRGPAIPTADPAVMITDTAFCRNASYHQPGDTWEKLDYVRMVVDGVLTVLTTWPGPEARARPEPSANRLVPAGARHPPSARGGPGLLDH